VKGLLFREEGPEPLSDVDASPVQPKPETLNPRPYLPLPDQKGTTYNTLPSPRKKGGSSDTAGLSGEPLSSEALLTRLLVHHTDVGIATHEHKLSLALLAEGFGFGVYGLWLRVGFRV
jgi:hypothetical protein